MPTATLADGSTWNLTNEAVYNCAPGDTACYLRFGSSRVSGGGGAELGAPPPVVTPPSVGVLIDTSGDPVSGGGFEVVDQYELPLSGQTGIGLPGIKGVLKLSVLLGFLPENLRGPFLEILAGLGAYVGGRLAISALASAAAAAGPWGAAIAAALYGLAIVYDSVEVDVDVPFVPSIPLPSWATIGGGDGSSAGGGMPTSGVPAIPAQTIMSTASAQHGPVVKTWMAPKVNGRPFVMFADGWIAVQRLNGTWHFYKPKKPVVYVPGGPMSRKTAKRLAELYQQEKKRAKKTFGLVDSKR